MIKGFLRICAGLISDNVMTFVDTEVTTPVTLMRLTQDNHAGWQRVINGQTVELEANKQMIVANKLTTEAGGQIIVPASAKLVTLGGS